MVVRLTSCRRTRWLLAAFATGPAGRRVFVELSVSKNLMLAHTCGAIKRALQAIWRELFPISKDRSNQQASTLSGEQQMLAVGRALMGRPRLLLLDEPSVGIAHRLKIKIFEAIQAIQQAAVLLVEQDALDRPSLSQNALTCWSTECIAREGTPRELANDDDIRRVYLGL